MVQTYPFKLRFPKSAISKWAMGYPADYIEAVTKMAFSTPNERLRIEVLLLLDGVRWPTASVILHFCHAEPYPILDIRALWSLGMNVTPASHHFDFWWSYTLYCRKLAKAAGVSMRELDRALWQYSKEMQTPFPSFPQDGGR